MPEWSNGLVLKTSVPKGTEGSNPSLSANTIYALWGVFVYAESKGAAFLEKSVARCAELLS